MDIFLAAFDDIHDPRADNARHDLGELLVVGFVAVLCGATNCAEMAAFGRAKKQVFRGFLKLRPAIPSHDTDPTVFRMIDPKALDAAFGRVLAEIAARLIAALLGPTRQRCGRCDRHRWQGAAWRARQGAGRADPDDGLGRCHASAPDAGPRHWSLWPPTRVANWRRRSRCLA